MGSTASDLGQTTSDTSGATAPRMSPTGWSLVAAIVVAGVVLRCFFTLSWNDPRTHVYSDMDQYLYVARKMIDPSATLDISDATHPPATSFVLGRFLLLDPSLTLAVWFQLLVSVLTPLAVGALGAVVFGLRAGAFAAAAASLYFPFIAYGGFFLAEVHFTMLLVATLALVFGAWRVGGDVGAGALGAAAGVGFSALLAFKAVALPAFATFWLTYLAFRWRREHARGAGRRGVIVLAAFCAGALPLTVTMTQSCTRLNAGNLCIAGNKGPADFLLGHYGRVGTIHWKDFTYGNPPSVARGYSSVVKLDFSYVDGPRNLAAAWYWVRQHPLEALVLSLDHLYDTFSATPSWPAEATSLWAWAHLFAYVYLVFLLAPLLWATVETVRRHGWAHLAASRKLLLFSPIFGLAAAVFLTNGEPRYRNPFDALLIVLVCALAARMVERRT